MHFLFKCLRTLTGKNENNIYVDETELMHITPQSSWFEQSRVNEIFSLLSLPPFDWKKDDAEDPSSCALNYYSNVFKEKSEFIRRQCSINIPVLQIASSMLEVTPFSFPGGQKGMAFFFRFIYGTSGILVDTESGGLPLILQSEVNIYIIDEDGLLCCISSPERESREVEKKTLLYWE